MIRLALLAAALLACGGSEKSSDGPGGRDKIELGDRSSERRSGVPGDEDEEEDGDIQISGTRGKLDSYDIEKGMEPHKTDLAQCYHAKIKRTKFVAGKVQLKYLVARDGTVKSVQVSESDLGAWPVEKCLLDIARSMQFPKPKGGEAHFSLPLDFSANRPIQWWNEERVDQEVGDVMSELSECEGSASDVWVTLYVGTRGKVKSAGFASAAESPLPDTWADCAEAKVKAWVLSDPRGRVAKMMFRFNP